MNATHQAVFRPAAMKTWDALAAVSLGTAMMLFAPAVSHAVPPNDNCNTPVDELIVNTAEGGTTVTATHDVNASCDLGGLASRDVWFLLDASNWVSIELGSSQFDPVLSVHLLRCGPDLVCNDNCVAMAGTLAGVSVPPNIYMVRVSDKGAGSGGTFVIRASQKVGAAFLPNDDCTSPEVVPSNATSFNPAPYSTVNAFEKVCTEPNESCDAGDGVSNSVWYSFTPATDGTLNVNTLGSTYDTILSIFTGSCTSYGHVACDDDGGGAGGPSVLNGIPLTAGTTYRIKVSDWSYLPGGGMLDFNLTYIPVSTPVYVPPVIISALTHTHFFDSGIGWTITRDAVQFPCAGGACSGPAFAASIGQNDEVTVRMEAPAGRKFDITWAGRGTQYFYFDARWQDGNSDTASNFSTAVVTFENLTGTLPTNSYSLSYVSNNGHAIGTQFEYEVGGDCSFTAVNIHFTVSHALADLVRNYGPVNSSTSPSFSSSRIVVGAAGDASLMRILPICEGNANGDAAVNIDDLVLVITNWGATGGVGDLNGDGMVNIDDLVSVVTSWGACR